jgi:hypothetical protein
VPNPYLRDPRRWAVIAGLTVIVVALELLFTDLWPTWGPFVILPVTAAGIALRIWTLRRRFRRDGLPSELAAWLEERAERRGGRASG